MTHYSYTFQTEGYGVANFIRRLITIFYYRLPPIIAEAQNPELLQNYTESDMISMKEHATRNGCLSRTQAKRIAVLCNRYDSCCDSNTSHMRSPVSTDRSTFNSEDAMNKECLVEKTNSLSIYKNDGRIILPKKRQETSQPRLQCFYCGDWYSKVNNEIGSCKEAPDPVERMIRIFTCYPIAQGAIYHCCRSEDHVTARIGRFGQGYNVYSLGPCDIPKLKRLKRWFFVALLSLLVPCLCCYLPAHMIYKCFGGGRRGRHQQCPCASTTNH